ncbi:hypothetical protein AVEN_43569-1 [Araneus ventricosus]|uniref:Peptidase aspartic putative domain-containing protein n=1 Tax=Araneus ventricosus TaxID=182803 RepID=A0A4Y2EL30_ARAVE|nr:hypothetical protein AVEN_43569-1 [Araneus ventricosus]
MLYPLVESCLPITLLRIWERHLPSITFKSDEKFNKLKTLMKFLGKEIEGKGKINFDKSEFGLEHKTKKNLPIKLSFNRNKNITTGMELYSSVQGSATSKNYQCVFCDKNHSSAECSYVQGLQVEQRKCVLIKKGSFFRCLKLNHISGTCRSKIKCLNCGRLHHLLMCFNNQIQTTKEISKPKPDNDILVQDQILANVSPTPHVLLQTLAVHLRGEKGRVKIREIIDSASQRSYILKSTAQRLNYQPHRRESLRYSLFGGTSTEICHHDVHRSFLTDVSLTYSCNFEVLGQEAICATITPVAGGSWMKERSENNIHFSDQRHGPIELLIGADVAGKFLTGGYKLLLSGLVAIETRL